jgi:isoamylase
MSQGVPMIAHGDELGRSQHGNNNTYCQDSELAWMHWDLEDWQQELLAFTRRLVELRAEHPVLRRRRFFVGPGAGGDPVGDIAWFRPDGSNMRGADWGHDFARSLMVFLNGDAIPEPDRRGLPVIDDSFLVAFNAHSEPIEFTIPDEVYGDGWQLVLDTGDVKVGDGNGEDGPPLLPGAEFTVTDRSVVVLRRPRDSAT